jgi:hypothetical protein
MAIAVAYCDPHDNTVEVRVAVPLPFASVVIPQRKASMRMQVPNPTGDWVKYFTVTTCGPELKPAVITLSAAV